MTVRSSVLDDYHQGLYSQAEKKLSSSLNKEIAGKNYTASKEAAWLLLDRAMLFFKMDKLEESLADFSLALDALDYYAQTSILESTGSFLAQDNFGAYISPPFEQTLARLYFALALFEKGDFANARALLAQVRTYTDLQLEKGVAPHLIENPIASYLLAAVLEKESDFGNATLLYKKAGCMEVRQTRESTVIVLWHVGRVPLKESVVAESSIVSAYLLETLLGGSNVKPALSSLTGIPIPKLVPFSPSSVPKTSFPLSLSYSISRAAEEQLKTDLPLIAARSAARFLVRRSAVLAFQERNESLGMISDLGVLAANLFTKADIRCWGTLPDAIYLTRIDLPAGEHQIFLDKPYAIHLKENELKIINIFTQGIL